MRRRFTFRSLQDPQYAYILTFDWDWERTRNADRPISDRIFMFQTYGDGITQHSNEWCVSCDRFADVCASLATFLQTDPGVTAEEKAEIVGYRIWPELPSDRKLAFFASVRYSDKAKRFYTTADGGKVSAAESRQYDKRWREVPSWADGSPQAVYDLIGQSDDTIRYGMERFAHADSVREWFRRTSDTWCPPAAEIARFVDCKGAEARREADRLASAFHALEATVQAIRSAHGAEVALRNYTGN